MTTTTTMPPQRYLMLAGDATDINTWSNIPYFLSQAGRALGFLDGGLKLQPNRLRSLRYCWNFWQKVRYGSSGGFQYSSLFAKQLMAQANISNQPTELISHFPLLPTAPWPSNLEVSYYIDATTLQVFREYGVGKHVGRRMQNIAIAREQYNYQNAKFIICMCQWAANSVVQDYKIDPDKVFVVPGGANLDEDMLSKIPSVSVPAMQPLQLGFIGKDWRRKGLLQLLSVAECLHSRGWAVEVPVIGPLPSVLPAHPLLRPIGFLDKNHDLPRFVELIRAFHFGCLFSQAEAFGISNRECLRLGVPVLATNVGGISDTVPEGLGHLFKPNTKAAIVADTIESYLMQPDCYRQLRQCVNNRANEFSWTSTVQQMQEIWRIYDA